MTTAPPDDDFDNALAVFTHDIRAILPEPTCQLLAGRIRDIHGERPGLDFTAAAELAKTAVLLEGMLLEGFLAPVDRPCGHDPSGGDCDAGCDTW